MNAPKTARTSSRPEGLAGWKTAGVVSAMLPSGAVVKIRPLRLEHHLTFGRTPDPLRAIALSDLREKINDDEKTSPMDRAEAYREFIQDYVIPGICLLVVEPEIKPADVPDLPPADVDYLQGILNRTITEDAQGRALGPEPLERYAIFREEHGCSDGCEACSRVLHAVSAAFG